MQNMQQCERTASPWHAELAILQWATSGQTATLCTAQATYEAFTATSPTLEAFEAELKKYMAVETQIASIPTLYNIGECWKLAQLPLPHLFSEPTAYILIASVSAGSIRVLVQQDNRCRCC
jgi:hypothetical protein